MATNYIQKNLDELRKRVQGDIVAVADKEYIDLDDEYMYEQLEDAAETDVEQHF